jgi:hypothetical protein
MTKAYAAMASGPEIAGGRAFGLHNHRVARQRPSDTLAGWCHWPGIAGASGPGIAGGRPLGYINSAWPGNDRVTLVVARWWPGNSRWLLSGGHCLQRVDSPRVFCELLVQIGLLSHETTTKNNKKNRRIF